MKSLFILVIAFLVCGQAYAQVEIRMDDIMSSTYNDVNNQKTDVKGDAKVISALFNVPISMKLDEKERPTLWSVSLDGSYTSLDNNRGTVKGTIYALPSEIWNTSLSISHLRPISEKWFINVSLGVGMYADHMDISKMNGKNIMGQGSLMFIMRVQPNLHIGAGLALDNNFGYPMAYPSLFIEWFVDGKYHIKAGMGNVNAGVKVTDWFNLNITGNVYGTLAFTEKDGKDMMFTHQYVVGGLQPEFKIGKSLSIPVTIGVSGIRPAFYQERTIKDFFKIMTRGYDPNFTVAPYTAIAIKWGF